MTWAKQTLPHLWEASLAPKPTCPSSQNHPLTDEARAGGREASKSLGKVVTFYFTSDKKKGMKERTSYL